jgi:hypothetical protein
MKARNGKIARLPKAIREQLNQRLADGMPGEALLDWLHSQPEVLEVLVRDFDARPILKQNLSEWRQGGFREWEARQERLEILREIDDEAADVTSVSPDLTGHLSAIVSARFASLMAATAGVKDWSKPRHRAQLMEMVEAIATLRRFDQGAARLKLEHEQLEMKKAELQLAEEAQKKRTADDWRTWMMSCMNQLFQEGKSGEELVIATHRLMYGDLNPDLLAESLARKKPLGDDARQEEETLEELADNIVKQRGEVKTSRAELAFQKNKLQMTKTEASDALLAVLNMLPASPPNDAEEANPAENQDHSTQDGQTESNPVKP